MKNVTIVLRKCYNKNELALLLTLRQECQPERGVRVNPKETPQPTKTPTTYGLGFLLVVGLTVGLTRTRPLYRGVDMNPMVGL